MNTERFWEIIGQISSLSDHKKYPRLRKILFELTETDIMVFNDLFEGFVAAIPALLIDAAQLVSDHSDDGVQAFSGWLISQGQELYEKSIKKPGLFARFLTETQLKSRMENELIEAAIHDAYKKVTGKDMPTWWDREVKRRYGHITKEDYQAAGKVKEIIEAMTRNPLELTWLLADVIYQATHNNLESWIKNYHGKKPGKYFWG